MDWLTNTPFLTKERVFYFDEEIMVIFMLIRVRCTIKTFRYASIRYNDAYDRWIVVSIGVIHGK